MRNADLLAELEKQRNEISMLSQRLAASEERAYNLTATLKWLQEQHQKDVGHLAEVVTTEKQRLTDVERHGRRLIKTVCNQINVGQSGEIAATDTHEEPAGVQHDVEDDSQSILR